MNEGDDSLWNYKIKIVVGEVKQNKRSSVNTYLSVIFTLLKLTFCRTFVTKIIKLSASIIYNYT